MKTFATYQILGFTAFVFFLSPKGLEYFLVLLLNKNKTFGDVTKLWNFDECFSLVLINYGFAFYSFSPSVSAGQCRIWRTPRSPHVTKETSTTAAPPVTSPPPVIQDLAAAAPGRSSLDMMGKGPHQCYFFWNSLSPGTCGFAIMNAATISPSTISENLQFCKMTAIFPHEMTKSSAHFWPAVTRFCRNWSNKTIKLCLQCSNMTSRT